MKFNLRRTSLSLTGLSCALVFFILSAPLPAGEYYPPRGEWERRAPQIQGFDVKKLQAALILAQEKAVTEPSDLAQVIYDSFNPREPDFRLYGPTSPREGSAGLWSSGVDTLWASGAISSAWT